MEIPLILLGLLSTLALSWTMDPTWNLTTLDAVGNVITLHNASDFVELSNIMKREVLTDFAGSTIVLDSDIDFTNYSDQFEPIGRNFYTLRAKFDGRGHTISNLRMNSTWRFVSIFAMINGTSFKNLVVDASCTIHSNHYYLGNNYTGYVGGIIGYIYPDRKDANSIIENLVNMASVSFNGGIGPESTVDTSYTFVGGGVIGYFKPRRTDTIIRNCVNFGEVSFTGKTNNTWLGGVLGEFLDIENLRHTRITMKNCANYGNLVHTGVTTGMLSFGGLTGAIFNGIVERCMNFGIFISNQRAGAGSKVIGGGTEQLTIKDCIWTQESDTDIACMYTYSGIDVIIENARYVVFDEKELADLNDWVDAANDKGDIGEEDIYSKWMALYLDGGSVGNASEELLPATIGLPVIDPTKEGHTFLHWCMDVDCTDGPATKEDILNETTTELYAKWSINNYTAKFIMSDGTIIEKVFTYNEVIVPPDMTGVKGFHGWNITYPNMPASDIIIFPNNILNSYTLTFDFNNGTVTVKILGFNAPIEYPDDPVWEGHTFYGWDKNITSMPARNLTITALWASSTVTIVFSKKVLGSEEIRDKIMEIASKENITITIIIEHEDEDTVQYIVLFVDRSEAKVKEFVKEIMNDEDLKPAISYAEINGQEWSGEDSNTTVIVVVVVVIVVVVVAVLLGLLGFFLVMRRQSVAAAKALNGAWNRIAGEAVGVVDASAFKSQFGKENKIYPKDYVPPQSIVAALMSAGLDEDTASKAAEECRKTAEVSREKGYVTGGLSVRDAEALCLYTLELEEHEESPYVMLNRALRAEKNKTEEVVMVRDVLYLVMTGLRKLPVVRGVTLYRGVREKLDAKEYKEGSVVVWPAFSSTSPDMDVTKDFLKKVDEKGSSINGGVELSNISRWGDNEEDSEEDEDEGVSSGTLFIIEDGWGYDIQPYSCFSKEKEILLEPEREFEVVGVVDSGDFLLVTLKMRKIKALLPDVFGERYDSSKVIKE